MKRNFIVDAGRQTMKFGNSIAYNRNIEVLMVAKNAKLNFGKWNMKESERMKEFVEKLISRLEELKKIEQNRPDDCDEEGCGDAEQIYDDGRSQGRFEQTHKIIEIVNQLAEEYNNSWISVEDALPELTEGTECFKQSPCCLVTLKWWDGDMTESVGWYNQSGVWNEDSKNCKVVAWMPLPPKYQPKGE